MADEVPDGTVPRWLDDEEQHAWLAYRHMTRQLEAHLARRLSGDSGLSMQDYDVLSALTDPPERRLCLKDLGNHLLWSPSRLSHHLDRMQRRGLVSRVECPDGRGNDVVLTARGLDAIVAAAPTHVAAVRAAFIDVVSPEDLAVLGRLSTTVLAGLRSRSG
ncbi:MarR family winged helix-turn-helix transcriptional regulator [Geodermatophilus sp. DSM 45219]|uniref:MarR family winged helix-turn-helix transcriptional regulator n=1 Tax=Geodermatophilus sp. DSM 45219 TaxID=1881103 RepID=UPI001C408FED|nr:MarR family winged helix-turn-helix transcriptional regulator [Geodermatophilus sp. DSM 45219]